MIFTDSPLSAELDAALARALLSTWQDLNALHFRRKLTAPTIALSEAASRLGQWQPQTRTIEISRRLVHERSWGVVVEVLKHEMAHQFVHEILDITDETAHGPAFQQLCERLGIDARAAGTPDQPGPGDLPGLDDDDARILRRIGKLLALAESSNKHEAEAAMAEAQRLMLRHNITGVCKSGYRFRHLGHPSGRTTEAERLLSTLLSEYFFVEAIWVPVWRVEEGKRGTVLEVCGTSVNIDMAEHVHSFLLRTADRLWDDYRAARNIGNRDRQSYLAGVVAGFRDKLASERKRHQKEGLIWVGDPDLTSYLRKRYPRISHTRRSGTQGSEAHSHGRSAGRNIVLHKQIAATTNRGRLLSS